MANLEEMLEEVKQEKPILSNDRLEGFEENKKSFDFSGIFNIFKAKSVDKSIEEYDNHTLNFDKKRSTGRIIRGLEGLLGALNFAIIDIIMGFVEKSKEKKGGE